VSRCRRFEAARGLADDFPIHETRVNWPTGKRGKKQTMKTTRMAVLLVFGFLAGCAFQSPIKDAQEVVSRARLRVISDERGLTLGFSGNNCHSGLFHSSGVITSGILPSNSLNGRSLGMPNPERITGRLFAEIYIEAERPFVFLYRLPNGLSQCTAAGRFVPQAGKDYEIRAWGTATGCAISLSIMTEYDKWGSIPMLRSTCLL
jgi:hypothetical protein